MTFYSVNVCHRAVHWHSVMSQQMKPRSVEVLTADIEHEEARAEVRDVSNPTYPVLARSLRKRRENIGATIAMLENLRAPIASALDTTRREVA
jgi:hypothetical protein